MTKRVLGLAALLTLTACGASTNVTPLRDQGAAQLEGDRTRCNEWAKKTAVVSAGYAACMLTAGYEAQPGVRSASDRVRLTRPTTANDPIGVLIDILDCDREAQREVERGLGTISKAIRDYVGWTTNTTKRRELFTSCLKPRGYDIKTS